MPEIVGGIYCTGAVDTIMPKTGRETVVTPSVTEMTIPEVVPTSAVAGVPLSWPLAELKVAHAGLLTIEHVRLLPSASAIAGEKL